ncbi:MAG: TetR/AcrR family transcriptional regulator [Candidatus Methylomirabilales bacterium]
MPETSPSITKSTKAQILDAALKLVHCRGFNHTTLEDILQASGIGKGNFYYYFKSKEELGYAILDRLAAWCSEQIPKEIAAEERPQARLDHLLEILATGQRKSGCVGGCPIGNLAIEMSDIHEGFRERIVGIFDCWRGHIIAILTDGRDRGCLKEGVDIPRLADFVLAGIEGAILLAKTQKDIGVIERCFAELRRHIAESFNS